MKPQHPNQHPRREEQSPEYLQYEWSKGYLPTENPKADEMDIPEERLK